MVDISILVVITQHFLSFSAGVALEPKDYQECMKFCKYAGSALQYQDSVTAIDYLTKALNLLTTGKKWYD